MTEVRTCINHPSEETRVACSSCGAPICPRCMRQAAVGQKCPECAKVPRSARALGKPIHYVKAGGGGLVVAVVGAVLFVQLLAVVRFGTLILAGVMGYVVGRVVSWGAQRQSQAPFPHIAVGCTVVGIAAVFIARYGTPAPGRSVWLLLAYVVAGYFAFRGVQG